jgi:hypothetical protein
MKSGGKKIDIVNELEEIKKCCTGERYPFWEKEERPQLIYDEIDDLIKKIESLETN